MNAVHLEVDTTLTADNIAVRGFVPTTLAVGGQCVFVSYSVNFILSCVCASSCVCVSAGDDGEVIPNMFREVRVELCLSVSEQSAVFHMNHNQTPAAGGESLSLSLSFFLSLSLSLLNFFAVARWSSPDVLSCIPSESTLLLQSMTRLSTTLGTLAAYVDDVAGGRRSGDSLVGMALAGVLSR